MFKPDLIEVWPDEVDFPLHRKWLKENAHRFNKIIIAFSPCNWSGKVIDKFVMNELLPIQKTTNIQFWYGEKNVEGDWRDKAIHNALKSVESEWIYFTEQDFFPTPDFWNEVYEAVGDEKVSIVAVDVDGRMHPCSLFIKKETLERTNKDFSANPPKHDHFGQIQKDLWSLDPPVTQHIIAWKSYYHMNGLTHNMHLLQSGEDPVYKLDEFKEYLRDCLISEEILLPEFKELAEYVIKEF